MTPVLVPPGVVIVTLTVPGTPAGAVAVACVADTRVKAAEAAPKWTAVAPVKELPVRVTVVPPATGP